jgi:murein DD-endopeptidase MepM/ murein hydrolase activator NlpD
MSGNKRLFTFLFASPSNPKIRKISIHYSILYAMGGLALLAVSLFTFGLIRMAGHEALNIEYLSVKAENERLKQDNDAYQSSYSRLKSQISYIEDMSKELARQARMENVPEIDDQIGMGGPETVSSLNRAADDLERGVRQINDRLRSDLLRLASIPSGMPVDGYVTDGFGMRHNPFSGEGRETHEGLDIAADFGTPVHTTADGIVVHAAPYAGYGNLVIIYHSNGITTRYGHLSRITVAQGQQLKRGEQIGLAGSTGRSTGVHVHYEVRQNNQPLDPMRYIGQARP